MNFTQLEINTEYQVELNIILERVKSDLGEDAAELFVYFVSGFSTAGGRATSAAQRIIDLCKLNKVNLKFSKEKRRFFYLRIDNTIEYLEPYGENRSALIPYIIESVLVAHRAMRKIPKGDQFEYAIPVVQEAFMKLQSKIEQ